MIPDEAIAALRKRVCQIVALAALDKPPEKLWEFDRQVFEMLANEVIRQHPAVTVKEMEKLMVGIGDELKALRAAMPRPPSGTIGKA
jgi:hypothetical protein